MAVRYSGEVEIRIKYERGLYIVSYKAPGLRGGGKLTARECRLSHKHSPTSPESYDKVAERVIGFLKLKGVRTGELRRVFQAPCPIPLR